MQPLAPAMWDASLRCSFFSPASRCSLFGCCPVLLSSVVSPSKRMVLRRLSVPPCPGCRPCLASSWSRSRLPVSVFVCTVPSAPSCLPALVLAAPWPGRELLGDRDRLADWGGSGNELFLGPNFVSIELPLGEYLSIKIFLHPPFFHATLLLDVILSRAVASVMLLTE